MYRNLVAIFHTFFKMFSYQKITILLVLYMVILGDQKNAFKIIYIYIYSLQN